MSDTYDITDVLPDTNYTVYLDAMVEAQVLETDVDSIVTAAEGKRYYCLILHNIPEMLPSCRNCSETLFKLRTHENLLYLLSMAIKLHGVLFGYFIKQIYTAISIGLYKV